MIEAVHAPHERGSWGPYRLSSSEEAWHYGVGVFFGWLDHLAEVVGGDAAHVVVHCGQDGNGLLGDVHASEDRGGLTNT